MASEKLTHDSLTSPLVTKINKIDALVDQTGNIQIDVNKVQTKLTSLQASVNALKNI